VSLSELYAALWAGHGSSFSLDLRACPVGVRLSHVTTPDTTSPESTSTSKQACVLDRRYPLLFVSRDCGTALAVERVISTAPCLCAQGLLRFGRHYADLFTMSVQSLWPDNFASVSRFITGSVNLSCGEIPTTPRWMDTCKACMHM
jgi:hypothetical protein